MQWNHTENLESSGARVNEPRLLLLRGLRPCVPGGLGGLIRAMQGGVHPQQILTSVVSGLFPEGVSVAAGPMGEAVDELYPVEREAVARAVLKRRREFAHGRTLARKALRRLGVEPGPIPVATNRAPSWPPGVVGSITHCQGLAAAVVGWRSRFAGLGLDAEVSGALDRDLIPQICTDREREAIQGLSSTAPDVDWPTLSFSAKEAVYKTVAAESGLWLGFLDVEVCFEPKQCTFGARLVTEEVDGVPDLRRLGGRYALASGIVLAGVVLEVGVDPPR